MPTSDPKKIYNAKGEWIGMEGTEIMSREEAQRRYPGVQLPMTQTDSLSRKIAREIWKRMEQASMELAKQPYCTYTPPSKAFKRKMLAEYAEIVRAALSGLGVKG